MEMMMGVMIIAILAGAAITASQSNEAQQMESVTSVLASDLSYARSLAVQYNTQWSVTFDVTNNQYSLVYAGGGTQPYYPTNYRSAGDAPSSTYLVTLGKLGESTVGDNGVKLAGAAIKSSGQNVAAITFGPLGSTTLNQDAVVWLFEGTGGTTRFTRITVSWVTGQVWIDRPATFTSSSQLWQ